MLGFAVLGVVVFYFNLYTAFVFVCLFIVTEACCELPVIVFFFLDFITLPRVLSTGLLSHSGQKYTVGSACIESNVLYGKKMSEGSGVKPLCLCVKIFVTVTFIISVQHKSGQ